MDSWEWRQNLRPSVLVKKGSKTFERDSATWLTKEDIQFFPPGKHGYEFVTENRNVRKISRLDRRLCELLKMENKNYVSKRGIILQPEDSQRVLPGRTVASSYESLSLQKHQPEWYFLSVVFSTLLWSLNLHFFWQYTYFFLFFKQWYIALLPQQFCHTLYHGDQQLPSYHSLFSKTERECQSL